MTNEILENIANNYFSILSVEQVMNKLLGYNHDDQVLIYSSTYKENTILSGDFDSDRGSYDRLCLELSDKEESPVKTVRDLYQLFQQALKQGEMVGYKGGEYGIYGHTDVTVGFYSETGDAVVAVKKIDDKVTLICKYDW
ncbi:hypothetical protein ACI2JA_03135 [Alkalihalobacillus sp. NPDC078783]